MTLPDDALSVTTQFRFRQAGESGEWGLDNLLLKMTSVALPSAPETLAVVPLVVPPLRERTGDISLLAEHFLAGVADTSRPKRLSNPALKLLAGYSFPGNVRELRNMAERVAILVDSIEVSAIHLKQLFPELTSGRIRQIKPHSKQMEQAEHAILRTTLVSTGWNVSKAAELLGLERSHLHKKMKALNIERPA